MISRNDNHETFEIPERAKRVIILAAYSVCRAQLAEQPIKIRGQSEPSVDHANREAMEIITPDELLMRYKLLPDVSKGMFIALLGQISSAKDVFVMIGGLSLTQQEIVSKMIHAQIVEFFFPKIMKDAIRVVKENPTLTDAQLAEMLGDQLAEGERVYRESIAELEAEKLKTKRDRKPSAETIKKYIEICDLRLADKALWTQGRLAKKFSVTPSAIRGILKEEKKWRRLLAEMSSK